LSENGKLKRLLDQGSGGPGHKFGKRRRRQVSRGEDEAGKEVGTVFGQPIVQLNSGAVWHAEIGDHDLVSARSRAPQLPERGSPIFRLVGFPSPAAEIAGERASDRRLVVDDQRPPPARYRSEAAGIGKDHEAWLKPRLM
jgi:hypothetical protein